jgi:hypothetical protein
MFSSREACVGHGARQRQTLALGALDAIISVWWLTLGGALLVSLHQTH